MIIPEQSDDSWIESRRKPRDNHPSRGHARLGFARPGGSLVNATALGYVALLGVVGSGVLWFRAMSAVRLPANRSGFVAAWLCAGALGVAALAMGTGWIGGVPAVLSIIGASFFLFTMTISLQQVKADAISVGATLPHFSAVDEHREPFDSASLVGHPVLIKFFRGHW